MKKLLIIPLIFLACLVQAQSITGVCLSPLCRAQKALTTDTGRLAAQMAVTGTTDTYKSITFSQASGPNTSVISGYSTVWNTGLQANVYANVTGTIPGTYIYKITGTTTSGTTLTAYDSLIVSAPAACPLPRNVSAIQISINGQLFTIPLTGTKITYSDGTTQ